MSESDQTWNATTPTRHRPSRRPTPPAPPAEPHQLAAVHVGRRRRRAPRPRHPATPTDRVRAPTSAALAADYVSWPPTQPEPGHRTTPCRDPYAAPGPYAAGPYAARPSASPTRRPALGHARPRLGRPPTAGTRRAGTDEGPARSGRRSPRSRSSSRRRASVPVSRSPCTATPTRRSASAGNASPNPDNGGQRNNGGFTTRTAAATISGTAAAATVTGATAPVDRPARGSLDTNAIAAKVDPAIVNINTTLAQGRAAGTGMIISSTGEILTNNHVIADATSIKVTIGGTGPTYDAKVVGYDVTDDVALSRSPTRSRTCRRSPSATRRRSRSATRSSRSATRSARAVRRACRRARSPRSTSRSPRATPAGTPETLEGMIQINAPIQPGDSGGALVDPQRARSSA